MSSNRQKGQVIHSIGCSEVETSVIVVPVHVVWVNAIAAFAGGESESGAHNVSYVGRIRVEPVFAWPAIELLGVVTGLELVRIRPPILVAASGEVAYDTAVESVKS